jgi:hypothetical protein
MVARERRYENILRAKKKGSTLCIYTTRDRFSLFFKYPPTAMRVHQVLTGDGERRGEAGRPLAHRSKGGSLTVH